MFCGVHTMHSYKCNLDDNVSKSGRFHIDDRMVTWLVHRQPWASILIVCLPWSNLNLPEPERSGPLYARHSHSSSHKRSPDPEDPVSNVPAGPRRPLSVQPPVMVQAEKCTPDV